MSVDDSCCHELVHSLKKEHFLFHLSNVIQGQLDIGISMYFLFEFDFLRTLLWNFSILFECLFDKLVQMSFNYLTSNRNRSKHTLITLFSDDLSNVLSLR